MVEKESWIIMSVIIGIVAVSLILGSQNITGKAVEADAKSYDIKALKVREMGEYSVNGMDFSLYGSESKVLLGGAKLFH